VGGGTGVDLFFFCQTVIEAAQRTLRLRSCIFLPYISSQDVRTLPIIFPDLLACMAPSHSSWHTIVFTLNATICLVPCNWLFSSSSPSCFSTTFVLFSFLSFFICRYMLLSRSVLSCGWISFRTHLQCKKKWPGPELEMYVQTPQVQRKSDYDIISMIFACRHQDYGDNSDLPLNNSHTSNL